jgi:hypothetical protein
MFEITELSNKFDFIVDLLRRRREEVVEVLGRQVPDGSFVFEIVRHF